MKAHEQQRFQMVGRRTIWLPDMDLNHDKQIQSLLCYRYTIGQRRAYKLESPAAQSRVVKICGGTGQSRRSAPVPGRNAMKGLQPWPGKMRVRCNGDGRTP